MAEFEFDSLSEFRKELDNLLAEKEAPNIEILRANFWEFCKYLDPTFFRDDKPKLKEIANILQKVADGEILYVIINVTVRTGKSYIISMFAAFMYIKRPSIPILRATANTDLYLRFSKDIQTIIESRRYQKIAPEIKLKIGSKSSKMWSLETSKQNAFFGGGMDKGIIGFGAEMLIIDDPHKGISEAYNDNAMKKVYRMYSGDLLSRLDPNAITPQIILHTRWNRKDLTGRLEEEQGLASLNGKIEDENGNPYTGKWHKYMYPALTKEEVSFDENIFPTHKLIEIRRDKIRGGEEDLWELMYQQDVISVDKRERLFLEDDIKTFKMEHLKSHIDKHYDIYDRPKVQMIVDPADSGENQLAALFYVKLGRLYYIVDVIYTHIELGHDDTDGQFYEKITKWDVKKFRYEKDGMGNVFGKLLVATIQEGLKFKLRRIPFSAGKLNKHQRIRTNASKVKDMCMFLDKEERDKPYILYMDHMHAYNRKFQDKNKLDAPDVTAALVDKSSTAKCVDAQS